MECWCVYLRQYYSDRLSPIRSRNASLAEPSINKKHLPHERTVHLRLSSVPTLYDVASDLNTLMPLLRTLIVENGPVTRKGMQVDQSELSDEALFELATLSLTGPTAMIEYTPVFQKLIEGPRKFNLEFIMQFMGGIGPRLGSVTWMVCAGHYDS